MSAGQMLTLSLWNVNNDFTALGSRVGRKEAETALGRIENLHHRGTETQR
jgi:hypothetical protein